MLVLSVPENLHELFQDRSLTAITALGELCRIVVMTVYLAIVFIIAILCPKNSRTHRTCEMIYVVFVFKGSYV